MMTPMSETPMRPMVEIDPNVRVRGNGTYAGLEDVIGPIKVGGEVTVRESEAGVLGVGRVTQIDTERQLVYLSVDWSDLRLATAEELAKATGDAEWLAAEAVVAPVTLRVVHAAISTFVGNMIVSGVTQSLNLTFEPWRGIRPSDEGETGILPSSLVGVC
jgi:hypothetical protein